jgi:DNA-binding XRE family transcriptional regulator
MNGGENMSRLRMLREENGKTQEEMAKVLGISEPNYSKKESGQVKVSLLEAKIVSDYFGMTIEEIFFASEVSKTETSGDLSEEAV